MRAKHLLTRAACVLLCAALLTGVAFAATYSPSFSLSAKRVLLINLDSGGVLYEKEADEPIEPSLLAQLMTVIVAIEHIPDLDNTMISMSGYVQDQMYTRNIELGGIRLAGLYKGEEIAAKKLLYAVMLRDAADAAMMLADYVGDGSIKYFTEMMNERAAELGATHTHFTDPAGLADGESYTTARDMALIAQYALSVPLICEMMETQFYDGGPTARQQTLYWNTTNKLIVPSSEYYNPSIRGIKVGWHDALGSYAVTTARRDGYTYLAVLLGCTGGSVNESAAAAFAETTRLCQWAFETFSVKVLLEEGRSFGEVPLRLGASSKDFLRVTSAENFTALIPSDIEPSSIRMDVRLPASVTAPVERGDLIGEVHLILGEEELGVVGIVAAEDAALSRLLMTLDRMQSITRTFWFKFAVVFLVLLIVLYGFLIVEKQRSRYRYRGTRRR